MNHVCLSIALVQKRSPAGNRWLVQRDTPGSSWQLIVSQRLESESFRETVTREVAWRLELDRHRDLLVSNMAQLSIEFEEQKRDERVHYALAFYNVQIYRSGALEQVEPRKDIQWLTAAEICSGETTCGESIDSRVVRWINQWKVLRPWQ